MANEAYIKYIQDWYKQRPKTPATFQYSPTQQQADLRSVQQQYRPYYQEQIDTSNKQFGQTLQDARGSLSRRGIWGAAGTVMPTSSGNNTVYVAGSSTPVTGTQVQFSPYGGQSGIRQQAEQRLQEGQAQNVTAFERKFQESVAQAAQQRQQEAYDVYQRTIQDPYLQQLKNWQDGLLLLQAQKGY